MKKQKKGIPWKSREIADYGHSETLRNLWYHYGFGSHSACLWSALFYNQAVSHKHEHPISDFSTPSLAIYFKGSFKTAIY